MKHLITSSGYISALLLLVFAIGAVLLFVLYPFDSAKKNNQDSYPIPVDSFHDKEVAKKGVPFGPFHLPVQNYGEDMPIKFTGGFLGAQKMSISEVESSLEYASKNNVSLVISLSGGGSAYSDMESNYSFDLFKKQLDKFRGLNLDKYLTDGTLIGQLIVDEPQDRNNWNGVQITHEQIRQMAVYTKSIWPNVPVGVGSNPYFLSGGEWSQDDLDFVQIPFTEKKLCTTTVNPACAGDTLEIWLENSLEDAKNENLGVVISLNVLQGDNPLSSTKVYKYGSHFLQEGSGNICALLLWKWDGDKNSTTSTGYFLEQNNSGITEALSGLVETAKSQDAVYPCSPNYSPPQ